MGNSMGVAGEVICGNGCEGEEWGEVSSLVDQANRVLGLISALVVNVVDPVDKDGVLLVESGDGRSGNRLDEMALRDLLGKVRVLEGMLCDRDV
ncbi:MAG: hypothetical protein HQL76_07480 [Magnetococcales bacterium]|nr:hypothetical protein [Magnetococcales bacterium]